MFINSNLKSNNVSFERNIETGKGLKKLVNKAVNNEITEDKFIKSVSQSKLSKDDAGKAVEEMEKTYKSNNSAKGFIQTIKDFYARLSD